MKKSQIDQKRAKLAGLIEERISLERLAQLNRQRAATSTVPDDQAQIFLPFILINTAHDAVSL